MSMMPQLQLYCPAPPDANNFHVCFERLKPNINDSAIKINHFNIIVASCDRYPLDEPSDVRNSVWSGTDFKTKIDFYGGGASC